MAAITEGYSTSALVFLSTFTMMYIIIKRVVNSSPSRPGTLPYPPSVGCLPVIGSLPYLPRSLNDLHSFLLKKSYTLGPVVSFSVGNMYAVVLNTHESIHEALVKKSTDVADRPMYYANCIFNVNHKGIIEHSYNAHFRHYHQLSLAILKRFGFGQNIMESRINTEVELLLANIRKTAGQSVDPKPMVVEAVLNVISSIVFGRRAEQPDDKIRRIFVLVSRQMCETMDLLALDVLPALRFLPHIKRCLKHAVHLNDELMPLVKEKIFEASKPDADEDNFLRCFIIEDKSTDESTNKSTGESVNKSSDISADGGLSFDIDQLIYTVRDFILAGTETSSTTVLWALMLLANHTDIQSRLQKEIDSVVPAHRLPSLEDKSKLLYVEAFILELMRFKTLVPLGVPHAAHCDTEVCGYFIPKGAKVFTNLYAAHMNVNVWKDPEVFRPERFLDEHNNIINKELMIAFSMGRRSCLGELLARQEIFLFLTGLIQQFTIHPPDGSDKVVCEEFVTFTYAPTSFQVKLLPRTTASTQ